MDNNCTKFHVNPTLPVLYQICGKLLFNNLSIVCNIKSFCQEGPQMLCAKFRANLLGGVRKSRSGYMWSICQAHA